MAQAPLPTCRTDTTARVEYRLEYLKDLVSSQDTGRVEMRRNLGIAVAPGRVTLVSDEALCQRALAALTRRRQAAGAPRQIWLYDAGSCFAVDDPSLDVLGSEGVLHLLDRRLRYRSGVVGI